MAMNAGAYAFFIKGVDRTEFLAGIKAAADFQELASRGTATAGAFSEVVFSLIIALTSTLSAG